MEKGKTRKTKPDRRPIREFRVGLSKDGKYFLFSDSTTWVIPRNYISTIDKNGSFAKVPKTARSGEGSPEDVGEGNDRAN